MQQSSDLAESIAALTPSQREQVERLLRSMRSESRDQDVLFSSAAMSEAAFAAIWSNPETTYTMPFDFGDVVLVRFPFTNQLACKQRPAVIISKRQYNEAMPDVVLMPITSQLRAATGELLISEWRVAGLLKPSAVKPVFATL